MPPQQADEEEESSSTMREEECLQEPLLASDQDDDSPPQKDIHLPTCCREEKFLRVNHNVFLNLLLAALYGVSCSLSSGTAYAAYLQKLGHDRNSPFGDIEAVYGLATLVTALPVGIAADRLGRSKVIRAGGVLLLLTTFVQAGIIEWVGISPNDTHMSIALWLLGGMNVFWGIAEGVVDGPCSALFADSTPEGERSKYYNYLFICFSAASAVGPLVSIILFQTLGDDWNMFDLRIVIFVGLGMEIFNACLMLLYDDKKALEENGERDSDNDESITDEQYLDNNDGENWDAQELADMATSTLRKRQEWIPYIIFAQDMIASIGSGMTIKFFPLFFKDEIGMTPSQVQAIFCISPLVMAITSTLGSQLALLASGECKHSCFFRSWESLVSMAWSTLNNSCLDGHSG